MSEKGVSTNSQLGKILKVSCVKCSNQSNHEVVCDYQVKGDEEIEVADGHFMSLSWQDDYQIIKCRGCDSISFRHDSWFSEEPPDDRTPAQIYPKRLKRSNTSDSLASLPTNLRRIYRETLECFNSEANTLAAAGLRALVEGLCSELGVKGGMVRLASKSVHKENLEGKINGLSEKGFLSSQHAAILNEHRFLGNEAVHELGQASSEELSIAIDIIEHTLKTVFEIPIMHNNLRAKRIQRKK